MAKSVTEAETAERVHPTLALDAALGRKLFHAAGDTRISRDGRACASCHPDGRDDGLVWATPDGMRQTPVLAGRLDGTAPFGWTGESHTVLEHLQKRTLVRLKGGGLRDEAMYALLSYLKAMPAPPRARVNPEQVYRGAAIFRSPETGCASCHSGGALADGDRHDVQSKNPIDLVADFDTPSLRLVAGSAPSFHDGRYATLQELLRRTDGSMGNTRHLTTPSCATSSPTWRRSDHPFTASSTECERRADFRIRTFR